MSFVDDIGKVVIQIHTVEIILLIDIVTFQQLLSIIPLTRQTGPRSYVSNFYAGKGIRQIELMEYSYPDSAGRMSRKWYVILLLNMSVMMGGSGIRALNLKHYTSKQILEAIQRHIYEVDGFRQSGISKVPVERWKVRRIDLAIDIDVANPALYTLLANLGIPYGHRQLKRAKINKPPDILYCESCCYSNQSKRLNLYNKLAAVKNTGQQGYELIPGLGNLLRIEYQLLKRGVRYNSLKWDDERSIVSYLDARTVTSYILKEMKSTFGTEKYVTYSAAVRLITQSRETDKEKAKMIRTIELIHQMKGLDNLEEALTVRGSPLSIELGNKKTFREKRLAKIRKLGINPVVIPDKYGKMELPGFYELITGLERTSYEEGTERTNKSDE